MTSRALSANVASPAWLAPRRFGTCPGASIRRRARGRMGAADGVVAWGVSVSETCALPSVYAHENPTTHGLRSRACRHADTRQLPSAVACRTVGAVAPPANARRSAHGRPATSRLPRPIRRATYGRLGTTPSAGRVFHQRHARPCHDGNRTGARDAVVGTIPVAHRCGAQRDWCGRPADAAVVRTRRRRVPVSVSRVVVLRLGTIARPV